MKIMNNFMKGIDVIVPVHKYDESVSSLLKRCLKSIDEMAIETNKSNINIDVHVVGIPELPVEEIMEMVNFKTEFSSFNIHENISGDFDFCSQVNFAVNNVCKNDYFMIVEFDDMVTPKWVNMALPYIKNRKKCPIFLPLVEVYDITKPTTPVHYINEIGWSSSFAENELGSLNNSALHDYCNFNVTGAIIKKDEFIKAGCFKPSIKLSFGYELLLRLTNLYNEIFIVPKVGYFHFINREDSLTSEYHKEMTSEEGAWWIKLAVEEYQYKKDRKKQYTPEKD
jgi:hypothetical protein